LKTINKQKTIKR